MRTKITITIQVTGMICTLLTCLVQAEQRESVIHVNSRSALISAARQAKPGTTISIAPGTYEGGLSFDRLQGEPSAPIILTASVPQHPPIIQGGDSGLHLADAAHLQLRYLTICNATSNGLNIDDGGTYDTPSHHIRLAHIQVHDIGPEGNRDGIKLSGVNQFEVDSCRIERWGSGGSAIDMVGCHDGKIAACTFRFRDDLPASGVQAKGGSTDVKIANCRFEHAGSRAINIGGSTGLQYFRPPPRGYEAKDITVEDCTFVGSQAPIAFVGVDGADVRYNTIFRPTRWVLRILQETRGQAFVPCRHGRFSNNLIVFRSDEVSTVVNVGDGTAPKTFQFAGNHWYCLDRPDRSDRLSLPVPEQGGTYGVDPRLQDITAEDLRLTPLSPVRNAGARHLE